MQVLLKRGESDEQQVVFVFVVIRDILLQMRQVTNYLKIR